jgi:uncharacterized membrane protein YoaK (UPF0700 family)
MKQDGTARFVDDPPGSVLLPFVLSVIAGSMDVIGFLGLGALFMAHITGNLVVLAARSVAGEDASVAHLLSVPIFVVALAAARLLAAGLIQLRIATLGPLLFLQFLFLSVFLGICVAAGPAADPNTTVMVFAAMLGVSAMAVQNALVQISLAGSPSTAVMTTNLTRLVVDLGEMLLGAQASDRAKAASRAWRTGTTIAGFVAGCGLGAWCQAHLGLWSLALPTGLALGTLAITKT